MASERYSLMFQFAVLLEPKTVHFVCMQQPSRPLEALLQRSIHVNYYTVLLKYADLTLGYGKAFPVRCDTGVSIKDDPQSY